MRTSLVYFHPDKENGYGACFEDRWPQRIKEQGLDVEKGRIVEEGLTLEEASRREKHYQFRDGFPVDPKSYSYIVQVMQPKAMTKEAQKKRVVNIDYKARTANTDWKARTANTDYKAMVAKKDYIAEHSHRQRGVIAISPDGTRNMYSGMEEAARQLTEKIGIKFYAASISNVCNPKLLLFKRHRGYTFEYADNK